MTASYLGTYAYEGGLTTSQNISYTQSVGSKRRGYVVISSTRDSTNPSSAVTWGGVSMTKVKELIGRPSGGTSNWSSTGFFQVWEILEADLPTDGAVTITITSAVSLGYAGATVFMIQDADQSAITFYSGTIVDGDGVVNVDDTGIDANGIGLVASLCETKLVDLNHNSQTVIYEYAYSSTSYTRASGAYKVGENVMQAEAAAAATKAGWYITWGVAEYVASESQLKGDAVWW